jgi:hypothetical protein
MIAYFNLIRHADYSFWFSIKSYYKNKEPGKMAWTHLTCNPYPSFFMQGKK